MRPTSWPELTETSARIAAKSAIQKKLPVLTFEEFVNYKNQRIDFSLKPVPVSPAADSPAFDLQTEFQTSEAVDEALTGTELAVERPTQAVAEDQKDASQEPTKEAPPPTNSEPLIVGVPESVHAEATAAELVAVTPVPEEVTLDQYAPTTAPDVPAVTVERGEVLQPAPDPAASPIIPEPPMELGRQNPDTAPGGESMKTNEPDAKESAV
jgi:hypothetical protein